MNDYPAASLQWTIWSEKRVIRTYPGSGPPGSKTRFTGRAGEGSCHRPCDEKRKGYIRILPCIPLSVLPGKKHIFAGLSLVITYIP